VTDELREVVRLTKLINGDTNAAHLLTYEEVSDPIPESVSED
jgi:hypothetical protein